MHCRMEHVMPAAVSSKLKCRYSDRGSPFLRLARVKEEEASLKPLILIYHDVIYDAEIETIKKLSMPRVCYHFWRSCCLCSEQNMDPDTNPPHEVAQACADAFCSQLAMFYIYCHIYPNSYVISLYIVLILCNNSCLSLPSTAVSCMWAGLHLYSKWASRKHNQQLSDKVTILYKLAPTNSCQIK